MRSLALLLAALLLAGCSAAPPPAEGVPSPNDAPRLTPTASPPMVDDDTGILRLVALDATPRVVDVGLRVALAASVRNDGPGTGGGALAFSMGEARSTVLVADVPENATREVVAELAAGAIGNFSASVRLGEEEQSVPVEVVGPRIAHLDFHTYATRDCGPVAVYTQFWNFGTGRARDVHADLRITDGAGGLLADFTTAIGDVAPGQHAESEGVIEELLAVCPGEEKKVYQFRLIIRASGVTETTASGAFGA